MGFSRGGKKKRGAGASRKADCEMTCALIQSLTQTKGKVGGGEV